MEYQKWIYPAGIKEAYEPGEEPFIVESADEEAALSEVKEPESEEAPKRRGRPPKAE